MKSCLRYSAKACLLPVCGLMLWITGCVSRTPPLDVLNVDRLYMYEGLVVSAQGIALQPAPEGGYYLLAKLPIGYPQAPMVLKVDANGVSDTSWHYQRLLYRYTEAADALEVNPQGAPMIGAFGDVSSFFGDQLPTVVSLPADGGTPIPDELESERWRFAPAGVDDVRIRALCQLKSGEVAVLATTGDNVSGKEVIGVFSSDGLLLRHAVLDNFALQTNNAEIIPYLLYEDAQGHLIFTRYYDSGGYIVSIARIDANLQEQPVELYSRSRETGQRNFWALASLQQSAASTGDTLSYLLVETGANELKLRKLTSKPDPFSDPPVIYTTRTMAGNRPVGMALTPSRDTCILVGSTEGGDIRLSGMILDPAADSATNIVERGFSAQWGYEPRSVIYSKYQQQSVAVIVGTVYLGNSPKPFFLRLNLRPFVF